MSDKKPQTGTSFLCLAMVAMAAGCNAIQARAADTLADALTDEAQVHIGLRWRYENVNQDGFDVNANGITLRTRLNFRSGKLNGFSAFVEVDNISKMGADHFNSGAGNSPWKTRYPVVADPSGSEFNQAYLQYDAAGNTVLRGGRQRINLDNQRFIGGVGWRQNEQTFDAVTVRSKPSANLELFYGLIFNVNRIFGRDVPAGDHNQGGTHLLHAAYNFPDIGKLTGYFYRIDNQDVAAFSTKTEGLRFTGKQKLNPVTVSYTAEWARQSDGSNNPVDYTARYYRFEGGVGIEPITGIAGFESLGGDRDNPGQAFRTPLATLHAFDGWTDKFLATPAAGLDDFFLGAKGAALGLHWKALYHNFHLQDGNARLGTEFDLVLNRKFAKRYGLMLKYAHFNGKAAGPADTNKFWVMASVRF